MTRTRGCSEMCSLKGAKSCKESDDKDAGEGQPGFIGEKVTNLGSAGGGESGVPSHPAISGQLSNVIQLEESP